VLGGVVTNAPLPMDTPIGDGCGSCQRCLPACPTGAIVEPGVIDARRCLAWIAQRPGSIPVEFRVALDDRIYGCDDCQDVCPPNVVSDRRSVSAARSDTRLDGPDSSAARRHDGSDVGDHIVHDVGQDIGHDIDDDIGRDVGHEIGEGGRAGSARHDVAVSASSADGSSAWIDLVGLLDAADDDLLRRYRHWYIADRDPRWLRRNALVALGNAADPHSREAQAVLQQWAESRDELLAEHARWAIDRLNERATQVGAGAKLS
jgi:epoxyqueuosine reductase